MPPAAVTYIGLPIASGGAHSLGRLSRRVAYERTMAFLETCTEPLGTMVCGFLLTKPPELGNVAGLEEELSRRFGDYAHVAPERISDVLDFLDDIAPQPQNRWGLAPIWFRTFTQFRILDPSTGRPLPGQDPGRFGGVEYEWRVPLGISSAHLNLHNSATLGVELCIPDADDDVLRRVVPWLQAHLPFTFSAKHWREWTPTKTGSFRARKRDAPIGI